MAFDIKNVDEDDSAYHELVEKGYRTIPVTFIGDQAVRGWDEKALRKALSTREG